MIIEYTEICYMNLPRESPTTYNKLEMLHYT